jgi:tRNA-2-methylthio-N6-dimethylallyladenosine synthase
MNVHDSEKMSGIFSESGCSQSDDINNADVIVLNTCSIRDKAEQKFYSKLGRLRKIKESRPELKIAVAGCIAQQKGEALFKNFPYVDFVFGPNNIDNLQSWIESSSVLRQPSDNGTRNQEAIKGQRITDNGSRITAIYDNPEYHNMTLPVKREGQVRAWVSIMYGCDNFCAYCVVPYTRGRERSRSSRDIKHELTGLASEGFKEVTLLGQNVNSYGKKLSDHIDFPDLLKELHEVDGIERIRFVTSHPKDLSDKLIQTMKTLPKLCNHIHLPLQAGSDKVLSLMNRRYKYGEYKEKVNMLKQAIPDISITSDIIVGFPGEDDGDFKMTLNALEEVQYDGIFAFKYSKRPDTKALDLPGHIDENVKSERLDSVLKLQELITFQKNKDLEGREIEVLVEGPSETDKSNMTGRTGTNKIVNFPGDSNLIGSLVRIKILQARQHSLFGKRVQGSQDLRGQGN